MSKRNVIIVGAGNAAMCAAYAAADAGAAPILLEKAPYDEQGGNTRFTAGLWRFAFDALEEVQRLCKASPGMDWSGVTAQPYPTQAFEQAIMRTGDNRPDPALTRWLVDESYDITEWVTRHGMVWEFATLMSTATDKQRAYNGGLILQTRGGGEGLIRMQLAEAERMKLEIRYETAATALLRDASGAVCGVRVRNGDGSFGELHGPVVLASGGFQANPEMRSRYLGSEWNIVKIRGSRFSTGEMLNAALEAGAQPFGHWAGAHATCIDPASPDQGTLASTDKTMRISFRWGICINKLGHRFVDEGMDWPFQTYVKVGRALMQQPEGIGWQVFDADGAQRLDEKYAAQTPVRAATLEELARAIGVPAEALRATVDEYNANASGGRFDPSTLDGVHSSSGGVRKSNWALPLARGPYVAYAIVPGLTFTFGGLKINRNSEVLDFTDRPIPGLFAAGEVPGGFFYHSYPAGSGLTKGAITGRAAGRSAAALA